MQTCPIRNDLISKQYLRVLEERGLSPFGAHLSNQLPIRSSLDIFSWHRLWVFNSYMADRNLPSHHYAVGKKTITCWISGCCAKIKGADPLWRGGNPVITLAVSPNRWHIKGVRNNLFDHFHIQTRANHESQFFSGWYFWFLGIFS